MTNNTPHLAPQIILPEHMKDHPVDTQYTDVGKRIIKEGVDILNERTGKVCRTVIGAKLKYDVGSGFLPIDTTRKSFYRAAVAEMIGYLRGYDNADQFAAIGANTWHKNANETKAWLANPHRKGHGDIGRAYGVQIRDCRRPDGSSYDQLAKVVNNLSNGIDDRGEILAFLNPSELHMAALRACMHTHTFSLLGDTLMLTSSQRSSDWPLGQNFNAVQVTFLLALMAQITGKKAGDAYHDIVNAHVYSDQYESFKNIHMQREPLPMPTFELNPDIKTLSDVDTWMTADDFIVKDYYHHPAIKYPMSE